MKLGILILMMAAALPAAAAPPELPETPFAPLDLLYAQRFELDEPMEYRWSKGRPEVASGWILVLEVDPAVAYPRQTALPVLYVGEQAAHYAMKGYPSGRVIVLVPEPVDLRTAPVWFGTPVLPEQVDAGVVRAERLLADRAGIGPLPGAAVEAARAAAGPPLSLRSALELEEAAAGIYARYVVPAAD